MHRFFTEELAFGGRTVINGPDAGHIGRVLRLGPGDAVRLCNGRGMECDAVIERVDADACLLQAGAAFPSETEPACRVTVVQCLPKGEKPEWIVQKCVELGAANIVFALSERCVRQPSKNDEKKLTRWQRVADEAAKQSRRGVLPPVTGVIALSALEPAAYGLCLVCYEEETAVSLKAALRAHPGIGSAALVIGPEGGFTPAEVAALTARGAVCVSLGKRILRTETAGMAALAELLYEVEL